MILLIILLLIICICFKFIYDQQKFNESTKIVQLQDSNILSIQNMINEKAPTVIHNLLSKYLDIENLTLDKLIKYNPGYIINDNNKNILFSSLLDNQMFILNNTNMIKDLKLDTNMKSLLDLFSDKISYNNNNNINILTGEYSINLSQNKNNIKIISQIFGESIVYLFNPKNKDEIVNKKNTEIKKWGSKINLKPGIILYIPSEWYYIIETTDKSIYTISTIDNYFTFIYNSLR